MQTSFEALQLKNELIKGLKAQNIVKPTAVQALTYSAFLSSFFATVFQACNARETAITP